MFAILLLLASLSPVTVGDDPREAYDVQSYSLDLRVEPEERLLSGSVTMRAEVVRGPLTEVHLDATQASHVLSVMGPNAPLEFEHDGNRIVCALPAAVPEGHSFAVTVHFVRPPEEPLKSGRRRRRGPVLWAETPSGAPWVGTSCQGPGAHSWWPCKSNYFNPEDKPERVRVALTVPEDLYAVSNGRLIGTSSGEEGWRTFTWQHDYPLETYTVTANVAPYVVVEKALELPGVDERVDFIYYVLPENAEKAALQFEQVPEMLRIFTEAFGPWPFPRSKFGLVETSFWGMEHSTAVAYGSSYPAWCEANEEEDRYASRNRWFDYILIHETAHEWWGNAVSTDDWGHFWIHEGFGTYAEGVYVEGREGRARADEYFQELFERSLAPDARIFRGDDPESGDAYSGIVYYKGASVLHTLRHYVDDDEAWWKTLREFNARFRYGNADTEDFRAVLEECTGRDWSRFFREWFYGSGVPTLSGSVRVSDDGITLDVSSSSNGDTTHQVPLDLVWNEAEREQRRRVWLEPGRTHMMVGTDVPPTQLRISGLDRILGHHEVDVTDSE